MRVAVTGAAGGLGRHVVDRAVLAGHEVVAIDIAVPDEPAPVEWRTADLTDLEQVRAALAGAQAVVHLGALTHPRYPEPLVFRTNVDGTHHVLAAAEEHAIGAVCLASSVNAIGGVFSATPRYDAFPVTEEHRSYCEDTYSLSKWIMEQESAAFARRRPDAAFTALRLHALRDDHTHAQATMTELHGVSQLWGWTSFAAAAAACLLALSRPTPGHAVCNIVAARTTSDTPSAELARRWYPGVAWEHGPPAGHAGFYATGTALAVLGWDAREEHPAVPAAERAR